MSTRKRSAAQVVKEPVVATTATPVETVVTTEEVVKAEKLEVLGEQVVDNKGTGVAETTAPAVVEPVAKAAKLAKVEEPIAEAASVEEATEKMYDCMGLKDHTCRIGGNVVTVIKDKYQTFPATVAMVLQTARIVIVK
jgi:hypothetical protein